MPQKPCITCGEVKDIDCFYRHPKMKDGHLNKCKECQKKASKKTKDENPERSKEFGRRYARKESTIKKLSEKSKTNEFKEAKAMAQKKYRDKYKKKYIAVTAVNNAKRSGELVKPDFCSNCLIECNPHAHHCDYNKPLDVTWLCDKCHKEWHISNKAIL